MTVIYFDAEFEENLERLCLLEGINRNQLMTRALIEYSTRRYGSALRSVLKSKVNRNLAQWAEKPFDANPDKLHL